MKLVGFETFDGKEVAINPSQVAGLLELSPGITAMLLSGHSKEIRVGLPFRAVVAEIETAGG